jgi:hypothetical protein
MHTGPRFAHGFQPFACIRLYNKIVQATSRGLQNHENEHVRSVGQGEARHIKYKRFTLGTGEAYDRLRD